MEMISRRILAAGALFLAFTASAAGDIEGNTLLLLAHAADARAAVFRSGQGGSMRVREGEIVPGTEFVLHAVEAANVELRARQSLNGRPLAVRLADGDSIDPQRLASARAALAPAPYPAVPNPVRVPIAGKGR